MPVTETIGERRTWAIYRIVGAIVFLGFVSPISLTIAFVLAGLWATGDIIKKLIWNERLMWGKAWPEAMLRWNYDIIYFIVGFEEWPGWMGWMPSNR